MPELNTQQGISILGVLFLAVILIFLLSYFNISIKAIVESPAGQENIEYITGGTRNLWVEYLREPTMHVWNDIWLKLFWRPFLESMQGLKNGLPGGFELPNNFNTD